MHCCIPCFRHESEAVQLRIVQYSISIFDITSDTTLLAKSRLYCTARYHSYILCHLSQTAAIVDAINHKTAKANRISHDRAGAWCTSLTMWSFHYLRRYMCCQDKHFMDEHLERSPVNRPPGCFPEPTSGSDTWQRPSCHPDTAWPNCLFLPFATLEHPRREEFDCSAVLLPSMASERSVGYIHRDVYDARRCSLVSCSTNRALLLLVLLPSPLDIEQPERWLSYGQKDTKAEEARAPHNMICCTVLA